MIERVAFSLARCWEDPSYRGRRRNGILDQEVDKASLLLIHTREKLNLRPSPFTMLPGLHGPGPALRGADGQPPRYICEVIQLFQGVIPAEHRVFSWSDPALPFQYFQPTLTRTDWDAWVERQQGAAREVRSLADFSDLIRVLDVAEIVALGRHPNYKETCRALRTLLADSRGGFLACLAQITDTYDRWWPPLSQAYERTRVASQKVSSDPDDYRNARRLIAEAVESPTKDAILSCRPDPNDIWLRPDVKTLHPKAEGAHLFARLMRSAAWLWAGENEVRLSGRVLDAPAREFQLARDAWHSGGRPELAFDRLCLGRMPDCADQLIAAVDVILPAGEFGA
jgi:hypothetical protein